MCSATTWSNSCAHSASLGSVATLGAPSPGNAAAVPEPLGVCGFDTCPFEHAQTAATTRQTMHLTMQEC
jgi:hypothetical protein